MPKLDLAKFLSDPKHQDDRDFIYGVIDARVEEIVKKKKAQGGERNFFDALFGSDESDAE